MNRLFLITFVVSSLMHGLTVPLVLMAGTAARQVYHDGEGQDVFKLEQGLTIQMISIGDAAHQFEQADVAPMMTLRSGSTGFVSGGTGLAIIGATSACSN